ncbi:hypothetical protein [Arthrobacter sp. ok362]|uniref:hypothetical protein n=1 Tax=Arthrobacter sp. ok362 TaxID=1761745 RepID=UPI0015881E18|nr:hypothetical protein [Arthrobacter sp. ok362]
MVVYYRVSLTPAGGNILKKTCAVLALAALALAGCSGGGQATAAATESATTTASPTPAPSPTIMANDEAGKKYMSIVCPTNTAIDQLNKAVEAQPFNVKASTTAAAAARDSYRKQIEAFSDEKVLWPATVKADIAKMAEETYSDLTGAANLASQTTESNFNAAWNAWTSSTATVTAQKVRLKLGLSSDAMGSCKTK